jgi:hypothetical protein
MKLRTIIVHRQTARLSKHREYLVYAVLGGTWLSGAIWLVLHFYMREKTEFGFLPHPLEAWALRMHGAFAFAALWLGGLIWAAHIPAAWASRRHRYSGIMVVSLFGLLGLSGYLLYYLGDEGWRDIVSLAHWLIGLFGLIALPLHSLHARTRRRRQRTDE